MTTQAEPQTAALCLAYGPRPAAHACYIADCRNTVPATPHDDFGYETEDGEYPICPQCVARLRPADASALDVLRVIAEAFTRGGGNDSDAAKDFLWTLTEGIELLYDPDASRT